VGEVIVLTLTPELEPVVCAGAEAAEAELALEATVGTAAGALAVLLALLLSETVNVGIAELVLAEVDGATALTATGNAMMSALKPVCCTKA
jgi:hypothetical protein